MEILSLIAKELEINNIEEAYNLISINEQDFLENEEFWNLKGILCLKVQEFETAANCFMKSLDINKTNGETLYNYAYTLNCLNRSSDSALYFGLAYRFLTNEDIKSNLLNSYSESSELKRIFEAAAFSKEKMFIMLSSCGWGDIYQRMHHIARSLFMYGHRVLYIAPSVEADLNSGSFVDLGMHHLKRYSWDNMRVIDGVNIIQPIIVRTGGGNYLNNYTDIIQDILDAYVDDGDEVPTLISYLPYQVNTIKELKGEFTHIYECVDDHSDLEHAFWGGKHDIEWEQELMDSADAITTTATALYLQRVAIENRSNVYMSKNAVNESDFFSVQGAIPTDLVNIPEPRIAYTGAIYERFDVELFYEVVKLNPDKSFVVIGFGKLELLKDRLPNLYFIEAKKHNELKLYLKHMQIGIIPFKDKTDLIINTDSIKHYEYLACGLPVVTTLIPDSGIEKPHTFLANTAEEFTKVINAALNSKMNNVNITDFIIKNNWHLRAALLLNLVNGKITEFEQRLEFELIGRNLEILKERFRFPVFDALYAVYLSKDDRVQSEANLKIAYERLPTKYIEKQYLRVLIINNNLSELIDVIGLSNNINLELKNELTFRIERLEYECVLLIATFCINDKSSYDRYIKLISDENIIFLYNNYWNYILGNVTSGKTPSNLDKESPMYELMVDSGFFNLFTEFESQLLNLTEKEIEEQIIEWLEIESVQPVMKVISKLEESAFSLSDKLFVEILKARVLVKDGRKEEVFKFLKEIERTSPNHRSGLLLAELYGEEGNRTRALQGYTCYFENISNRQLHKYNKLSTITNKTRIALITTTSSGCNARALSVNIPEYIQEKYEIRLFQEQSYDAYDLFVKESDMVITTQANYPFNNRQINIELWHGFPIKAMERMDLTERKSSEFLDKWWENVDIVSSYSSMFNTLFNSCIGLRANKYKITGAPRNDLLAQNNRVWFYQLSGIDLTDEKIIIYTPTFRSSMFNPSKVEGERSWSNFFGFEHFQQERFNEFLEQSKITLFVKYHWVEEATAKEHISNLNCPRVRLITEGDIVDSGMDFYELLSSADLLITDYSSIFFDYLLLDRPIIFTPTDLESYKKNRGFLLEPYEFWTPGPKVYDQVSFQEEISKSLGDKEYFSFERKQIRSLIHQYNDFNSSDRVWELIDQELSINDKLKLV